MALEESILKSTKKKLNVNPDDTAFDIDLIDQINTAFFHLHQLGVGPTAGFQIEDDTKKWTDFLPNEEAMPLLNAVKTNVQLRVRQFFDPPQLSHMQIALKEQLLESDVRINILREETAWVDPDPSDLLVVDGGSPEELGVDGGNVEGEV
jgi:hypothetical protein